MPEIEARAMRPFRAGGATDVPSAGGDLPCDMGKSEGPPGGPEGSTERALDV